VTEAGMRHKRDMRPSDNKTIVGAVMDGYFRITLISLDSIEKCYTHNGTSPTHAIVATLPRA